MLQIKIWPSAYSFIFHFDISLIWLYAPHVSTYKCNVVFPYMQSSQNYMIFDLSNSQTPVK